MPSSLRSKSHSGPVNRSCGSSAAIGSTPSAKAPAIPPPLTLAHPTSLPPPPPPAPRPTGGRMDAGAWPGTTLPPPEWLPPTPPKGEKLTQQTEVRAGYDERYLSFAFHCVDPELDKVRSTISRRDSMFDDDWVGL